MLPVVELNVTAGAASSPVVAFALTPVPASKRHKVGCRDFSMTTPARIMVQALALFSVPGNRRRHSSALSVVAKLAYVAVDALALRPIFAVRDIARCLGLGRRFHGPLHLPSVLVEILEFSMGTIPTEPVIAVDRPYETGDLVRLAIGVVLVFQLV